MAATASVTNTTATLSTFEVVGSVTLTGSFLAHGDYLDLSALGVPSNTILYVEVNEATPAANKPTLGAQWIYLPGTTLENGVLEAFNGTTELTATANTYASLSLPTNFTLSFVATFKKYY
jgi:hypothetical protein